MLEGKPRLRVLRPQYFDALIDYFKASGHKPPAYKAYLKERKADAQFMFEMQTALARLSWFQLGELIGIGLGRPVATREYIEAFTFNVLLVVWALDVKHYLNGTKESGSPRIRDREALDEWPVHRSRKSKKATTEDDDMFTEEERQRELQAMAAKSRDKDKDEDEDEDEEEDEDDEDEDEDEDDEDEDEDEEDDKPRKGKKKAKSKKGKAKDDEDEDEDEDDEDEDEDEDEDDEDEDEDDEDEDEDDEDEDDEDEDDEDEDEDEKPKKGKKGKGGRFGKKKSKDKDDDDEDEDDEDDKPSRKSKGKSKEKSVKKSKSSKAEKSETKAVKIGDSTVLSFVKKRPGGGPKSDLIKLIPKKGIKLKALLAAAKEAEFNTTKVKKWIPLFVKRGFIKAA